ncbi:carbohydrate-binding module family 32 protein [Lentithecium fluviatile CBS 122367]|uniref:alpha,alpha-trehalase n=1 Tax=Lentithecium fluviatile CBS 122367 TaxID=1168545 RepID=A0A6G1JBI0_9PLEO|nr:carbohydrate-binding module family 32 protein [Lentithecium fluviatile CBS 122367]
MSQQLCGLDWVKLNRCWRRRAATRSDLQDTDWDDDNWLVRSDVLDTGHYQTRMSLANGYLGINVATTGPFFEVDEPLAGDNYNGWPLYNTRHTFASIAGFYTNQDPVIGTNYPWLNQYGKESFVAGIPHWSGLVVEADGHFLNASVAKEDISHYSTKLDVAAGLLSWEYTWKPSGGDAITVEYSMLVHKLYVNQAAVQLKLTASRDINVTVYDVLEGNSASRTDFFGKKYETHSSFPMIWTAVSPIGVSNVTAYVYSSLQGNECVDPNSRKEVPGGFLGDPHDASIAQSVAVKLVAGKTAVIGKFIGIASTDAFEDPKSVANAAAITGATLGFATLLHSHIQEWASILTRDSVDSYHDPGGLLPTDIRLQELQVISVTTPFMILQNTVGPNAIAAAGYNSRLNIHSIPVCGIASDCYGGLVFWDAETWMALGLQVSHPQHIETVVNYRVEKYPQAKENIKTAFTSSKNQTGRFSGGAVYPWTSARYGNCTGTGPCFDYEYHVNGDIAITFRNQFAVTGDAKHFKDTLLPITNDLVYFLSEALDYNETSGYYELWNATDPDEYANNVNNVGYATALIQRLFNETNELNVMFGLPHNETWNKIGEQMRLPVDEEVGIILEYGSMNGSIVVKQADVVLLDDILHYENPYSLNNLDYYANKQSIDGPGMTYAAFSIVANEISPSGCSSYTYDTYSSQPYIRAPFFQFSEQLIDNFYINGGTHPAFPFLTGMGGANRVAIFGYLGLRLFVDKLDVDPSLPPQVKYLNYRTFYWQGYGINATSNSTHTTLARLPNKILPTANKDYASSPLPVTLGTRPGKFWLGTKPLVLKNRMIGQTPTVAGNILQCKRLVQGDYLYLPGQFPIAAIDGASSTKWQPENSTRVNYISVDLGADTAFHPLKSMLLDWGAQPPAYYEVLFTNTSIPPFDERSDVRNVTAGYVEISEPYDPRLLYVIRPVKANQTNVTLEAGHWSGRYAHLGIKGNLANESSFAGGTVAEWSVVADFGDERYNWRYQEGY